MRVELRPVATVDNLRTRGDEIYPIAPVKLGPVASSQVNPIAFHLSCINYLSPLKN